MSPPRPLVAGSDACDYCRMTISDVRFGGELESGTGQLRVFDAVECLASYYLDASTRNDVRHTWVVDFESGRFVPVDSALFVRDATVSSPMGRAVLALAPEHAASATKYGGQVVDWAGVQEMMRVRGLTPGAAPRDTASPPQ